MVEAEAMRQRDPSSIFPIDTKAGRRKLARNMLQQLEWDTKRDFDPRNMTDNPRAFFEGFAAELKAENTINWLANEIEHLDSGVHGVHG